MLWRKTSTANKTCPICRVKSSFVIKTSVYPYNPGNNADITSNITHSSEITVALKELVPQIGQSDIGSPAKDHMRRADVKLGSIVKEKTTALLIANAPPGQYKRNYLAEKGGHHRDPTIEETKSTDPHNLTTCEGYNSDSPSVAPVTSIHIPNGAPVKRKRTRRKPVEARVDSNPAKTLLVNNYLQRTKTIPCKYFCNPNTAKIVGLDDDSPCTQSICWGYASTNERKIPFCKYGNTCHYSHPHPDQLDKEYEYDEWERRILGISRRRKKKDQQDVNLTSHHRQPFFVMAFLASAESPSIFQYPF